jgi:hypothetical protein
MAAGKLCVSYFSEDASLGQILVKALEDRNVQVWESRDRIPTASEVFEHLGETVSASVALLLSDAAGQTIGFNDELFRLIDDDLSGKYPKLIPLRVANAELPPQFLTLHAVSVDEWNVGEVADLLADIAAPERHWESSSPLSVRRAVEFERHLSTLLRGLGLPYRQDIAVGGVMVDFEIVTAEGRRIIFEAKTWPDASPRRIAQGLEQVRRIAEATGTADVYLVVPEPLVRSSGGRVLGEQDFVRFLSTLRWRQKFSTPLSGERVAQRPKVIFAAMPFTEDYDDTYWVAMLPAAEVVGGVCRRVDMEEYAGDIVDRIETMIRESDAVIADLSEGCPNVLYEAGFAHALGKETIHISSTPLSDLPFDVRNWNTIGYKRGKTHALRVQLEKRLRAVL